MKEIKSSKSYFNNKIITTYVYYFIILYSSISQHTLYQIWEKVGKKSDQLRTRVRTLFLSFSLSDSRGNHWGRWQSVGGKMKGTTRSAFFSRTLTRSHAWRIRPPLRLHTYTCVTSTRRLAVFSALALIGRRHKRMKLENTR